MRFDGPQERAEEIARRDPLGLHTLYYRPGGRGFASTMARLLEGSPGPRRLSRRGVAGYLDQSPVAGETCLEGVAEVPAGHALLRDGRGLRVAPAPLPEPPSGNLLDLLAGSVRRCLESQDRIALALSGGLDSALVLGIVERLNARNVIAYTLSADLEGYAEIEDTSATARFFHREVQHVDAGEEDFVSALPASVAATETPLYNLHPVSKYLLARRLRADGIRAVLTGDGADQVFCGVEASNYIPLVGSLFASQGVELCSPFLAAEVVSYARLHLTPDPGKKALRDLGRGLVPDALISQEKRCTLTPPLDLSRYWDPALFEKIADSLDCPLPGSFESDADRVKWVTLSLLYKILVEGRRCGG